MGIGTILLLLLGAILIAGLMLAEIFFIPGFGLLGLFSILGFIGGGGYLIHIGMITEAIWLAVLSIILFVIGFLLMSRNKFINKVALKDTVDEVANKQPEHLTIGARGKAISRMTLIGEVEIEGCQFEAESESGFIEVGEEIHISRISNNKIYVKRVEE